MKNIYEIPLLEIISTSSVDIITTSIGDSPFEGEDDELNIGGNSL
jgi:hypothetical protein